MSMDGFNARPWSERHAALARALPSRITINGRSYDLHADDGLVVSRSALFYRDGPPTMTVRYLLKEKGELVMLFRFAAPEDVGLDFVPMMLSKVKSLEAKCT